MNQRARTMLEKLSGNNKIQPKKWTQEIGTLEKEIEKLNGQSETIKERYEQINHIKYAVGIVNEEYGIELSIEIDKAIKRGEKESVIKKLQEFKKDSDSYNRKRQATKDYYKNKDNER